MTTDKISIIVPVYNNEQYLSKCITSIIDQTYKYLEIILVNDGSLDNSLKICNEFAKKDDRIIVIDKENGGVSSARNRGLDIATGVYIGFVDSDDYISAYLYEKLMAAIKDNNADIAECGYYEVNEDYEITRKNELSNDIINGNYECSYNFAALINTEDYIWNKLFDRRLFQNIRFPGYTSSEDYVVNIKVLYECEKKANIGECLYYYFINEKGACKRPFSLSRMDTIRAGKEAFRFHQERFEDLCPYISLYICNCIIICYLGLQKCNDANKKKYISEIIKDYRLYYPKVTKTVYNKASFSKKHLHYIIFRFSPTIYSYFIDLFKFGRKIRNFKK